MSDAIDRVTKAWKTHWETSNSRPDDSLRGMLLQRYVSLTGGTSISRHNLKTVLSILGQVEGKSILDAGCGTGLNSLPLAARGADVTLLDIAPEALAIAKTYFTARQLKAKYVEGSIFAMPFPDHSFDVVWNTGVIEHFEPDVRKKAVTEMLRVMKPDGVFLTLNPSAEARIYRYAKSVAERNGTWDVGFELPLTTLRDDIDTSEYQLQEWREAWFMQFHFLKYVLPKPLRLPYVALHEVFQTAFSTLNRWPGYTLVSVIRRLRKNPEGT